MTCEDASGRSGSPGQVKMCVERLVDHAKESGTAVWLVGHITSNGDVAGPKTIEHVIDTVLELKQGKGLDGRERIVRCARKNRYGDAGRAGYFELTKAGFVPAS